MTLKQRLALSALLATLAACGADTDDDKTADPAKTTAATDDESTPTDGTGNTGKATLGFGTSGALALEGDTAAAAGIVSGDCTITSGFASIGAIKVKVAKESTAKDVEIHKADLEDDKAANAELDAADTEAEAAAAALAIDEATKGDKAAKMKAVKQAKAKKLAEKKTELRAKLKDRHDKAKSRDRATRFDGPFVLDLMTGKLVGDKPAVDLPDGSYRRIEFKLRPNFDVEEANPLFARALVVSATCVKGAATVPVEIEIHHALNFRMRGDAALAVSKGGDAKIGIVFDVKRWFEGLDLTGGTLNADGVVVVNRGQNRELWQQIRKNVKMRSVFGHDKNADEKIAADEKIGEGEDVADADAE